MGAGAGASWVKIDELDPRWALQRSYRLATRLRSSRSTAPRSLFSERHNPEKQTDICEISLTRKVNQNVSQRDKRGREPARISKRLPYRAMCAKFNLLQFPAHYRFGEGASSFPECFGVSSFKTVPQLLLNCCCFENEKQFGIIWDYHGLLVFVFSTSTEILILSPEENNEGFETT